MIRIYLKTNGQLKKYWLEIVVELILSNTYMSDLKLWRPSVSFEPLAMERLEARRLRTDLVTAYKITFGLTILNRDSLFKFSECSLLLTHGDMLTNSCSLLVVVMCETIAFLCVLVKVWNSLPPNLIDFTNIYNSKRSLNYSNCASASSDNYFRFYCSYNCCSLICFTVLSCII